jgi:hypothetical protein
MRWKLRAAIKGIIYWPAQAHPACGPFIGRIERGLDFLGNAFSAAGLGVAAQTVKRFAGRLSRLYDHDVGMDHIGAYVRRWLGWVGVSKSWYRDLAQATAGDAAGRQGEVSTAFLLEAECQTRPG